MGILSRREDRPTPAAVYNWRVYTCACIASFAAMAIGYDSAFIGGTLALPSFMSEFGLDKYGKDDLAFTQSNIVSVYQAGAFFGAIFAFVFAYFLGRRNSLFVFVATFIVGAGMNCGAKGDRGLGLIIGGRVLTGIGVGGCSNLVPVYISELSPPAIRGRLVGLYELGWQMGGLVGFWINYGVSTTMSPTRTQWVIPFAVQLIPAGVLGLGALWIKESPRWLFQAGKRDKAMANLCWVRKLDPTDIYIIEEVAFIDDEQERYQREVGAGFWKPFTQLKEKRLLYRLFLGGMLFLWQNGSGINAINYYSPIVFRSIGIRGTNTGLLTTGIFGVVKTTLTFVWLLYLVDHVGRRNMLLAGSLGGSICMWIVGSYIAVADPENNQTGGMTPGGTAAVFFFYLWTAFYTPSWNGTPWVVNSEMFDQNTRSLGQTWASMNNWFWNFIIARFTPQMFIKMTYGVYFFFASLMLVSIVFVWFLLPETKTVPLEGMDRLFEIKPVRHANKIIMDELSQRDAEFRANAEGADLHAEKAAMAEEEQQRA